MCGVEVVKALVSPVEKLIGGVSSAIGKAYEPRQRLKLMRLKLYRKLFEIIVIFQLCMIKQKYL